MEANEDRHAGGAPVVVSPPTAVKVFCGQAGIKPAAAIKYLFREHGMMLTPNALLDEAQLVLLAEHFEIDLLVVS